MSEVSDKGEDLQSQIDALLRDYPGCSVVLAIAFKSARGQARYAISSTEDKTTKKLTRMLVAATGLFDDEDEE